ncbi:hypothetical protein HDU98_002783 [Podochytrium sp. JEL0797]|nr:hypothetical protein HDU98_002783 [Podochytrium sp. JEL0797]
MIPDSTATATPSGATPLAAPSSLGILSTPPAENPSDSSHSPPRPDAPPPAPTTNPPTTTPPNPPLDHTHPFLHIVIDSATSNYNHTNHATTATSLATTNTTKPPAKQTTTKNSIAFFLLLDKNSTSDSTDFDSSPILISPTSESYPTFQNHASPASPTTLATHTTLRLTRAHMRRTALLRARTTRLRRRFQHIHYKVLLQHHNDRIRVLRIKAHIEYKGVAADLNRRVADLMRRWGRRRGREEGVAVGRALQRAVNLRRALSENFVEFLREEVAVEEEAEGRSRGRLNVDSRGLVYAASLDELGLRRWNQEQDESDEDDSDYFGGEETGAAVAGPPSSSDSASTQDDDRYTMTMNELSEIINALKIHSSANDSPTASSSQGESMTSFNDSLSESNYNSLLAQFESTFSPTTRQTSTNDTTQSRIDSLFDLIKSLSENKPAPSTPSTPSSFGNDDTLEILPESLSSPKKRTMISTSRLTHLLGLQDAATSPEYGTTPGGGTGSPSSPARRKSSFGVSPGAKMLRKRDLLDEPLSQLIQRNKSLPVQMLEMLDEHDYMELVPLLPPITRFTLRELDIDEILLNPQLRHDLYFDPNLQFKPNTDGTRGDLKRQQSTTYWTQIATELAHAETYRLPLLIHELKQIVKELLPYSSATQAELEANLDVELIAQKLEHGVFDAVPVVRYLTGLLKLNCAPARDALVDEVLGECEEGRMAGCLRKLFEVMELMKLDYANHQLTRIRPHVLHHAIEFEQNWFKDELRWSRTTTHHTEHWFKQSFQTLLHPPTPPTTIPTLLKVYTTALLTFLQTSPLFTATSPPATTPELFSLDHPRLLTFHTDLQDITILSSLLLIYRQLCGPQLTPATLSATKRTTWVLLNDTDTSLDHVVLELCRSAGGVRGREVGDAERRVVLGCVEKTLERGSKVFEMVMGRVGRVVFGYVERVVEPGGGGAVGDGSATVGGGGGVLDRDELVRYGLVEMEEEVQDLAERVGEFARFNVAVYFEVLARVYGEVRGEVGEGK